MKYTLIFAVMTIIGVHFLAQVCTKIAVLYIPVFAPKCYNKKVNTIIGRVCYEKYHQHQQ